MPLSRLTIFVLLISVCLAGEVPAAEPEEKVPAPPCWQVAAAPGPNKFFDDVLKFWEFKRKQIEKFRCTFERWTYQPGGFGPSDPNTPYSHSTGTIRYEQPDKWRFHVETVHFYKPPRAAAEKATYEPRPGEFGEHWVCDGKRVFEFRHDRQQLAVIPLPAESQGKAFPSVILQHPWFGERELVPQLPFFADIRAQEMKDRFWMRVTTPKDAKNQYWIEAWPKRASDAAHFKMVEVILSASDFLPEAMQIHSPAGRERTVFAFRDRETSGAAVRLDPPEGKRFYEVELPTGWTKVEEGAPASAHETTHVAPSPGRRKGFFARWRARRQARQ